VEHVFDFPSSPRCVVVRVATSDAVEGSHVQRSPLSMGGLGELESGVLLYEKNPRALMREMRHSNRGLCATLTTSLPSSIHYELT